MNCSRSSTPSRLFEVLRCVTEVAADGQGMVAEDPRERSRVDIPVKDKNDSSLRLGVPAYGMMPVRNRISTYKVGQCNLKSKTYEGHRPSNPQSLHRNVHTFAAREGSRILFL